MIKILLNKIINMDIKIQLKKIEFLLFELIFTFNIVLLNFNHIFVKL